MGLFALRYANLRIPEFKSIQNIESLGNEGLRYRFKADLQFYNPNRRQAELLNTEIRIFCEDLETATAHQIENVQINPDADFIVPIDFEVDAFHLARSQTLSGILDQVMSKEKKIKVIFKGYTRVRISGEIFKIPIDQEEILRF